MQWFSIIVKPPLVSGLFVTMAFLISNLISDGTFHITSRNFDFIIFFIILATAICYFGVAYVYIKAWFSRKS